ncbi:hypothetical protein BCR35DRAFT_77805 [Leucosporidium creatinivorum]|uniref:Uncharacterized protein n=1 Tax=Leucosporidium creatinivorum TaxID=106004 RepID=A0A1Y2FG46_9BASI|nr:hypothetical protein BCR35DRAFT_77805 [Leucosporidium creatinivorum]
MATPPATPSRDAPSTPSRPLPPSLSQTIDLDRRGNRSRAGTGSSEVPSILVSPSSPVQREGEPSLGREVGREQREEEQEGREEPTTTPTPTPAIANDSKPKPNPASSADSPTPSSFSFSSFLPSLPTSLPSISLSSFIPRLPTTSLNGPTIHLVHSSSEAGSGRGPRGDEGEAGEGELVIEQEGSSHLSRVRVLTTV